jgi:hypothetical protein
VQNLVFISYAREDQSWAERLYMDLRKQEIDVWLDVRCLKPGASWKMEIRKAIRESRYFILLISKRSVTKRGFVQRELKEALQSSKEFPAGEIFLIPTRLDETIPIDEDLQELNWVNLFPRYNDGLARILSVITAANPAPLIIANGQFPTVPETVIDRGREVTLQTPLILGGRAAINYTPFRTARDFLQQLFDRLPTENMFSDHSVAYFVTADTRHPDFLFGDDLRDTYPEYITLVFQRVYRELQVRDNGLSVIVAFNGVERTIAIPYEAIRHIRIEGIGVSISFD